jgi:hypothetical protein
MKTISEIRRATSEYVDGIRDFESFQDWFLETSLGGFSDDSGCPLQTESKVCWPKRVMPDGRNRVFARNWQSLSILLIAGAR